MILLDGVIEAGTSRSTPDILEVNKVKQYSALIAYPYLEENMPILAIVDSFEEVQRFEERN